jgi:hypothetical protein
VRRCYGAPAGTRRWQGSDREWTRWSADGGFEKAIDCCPKQKEELKECLYMQDPRPNKGRAEYTLHYNRVTSKSIVTQIAFLFYLISIQLQRLAPPGVPMAGKKPTLKKKIPRIIKEKASRNRQSMRVVRSH